MTIPMKDNQRPAGEGTPFHYVAPYPITARHCTYATSMLSGHSRGVGEVRS